MSKNVIEVRDLVIKFPMKIGTICPVNNVSFDIPKGKITALVGESGSGKSTIATAILRSVSSPGVIENGAIYYNGEDILKYDKNELQNYKWDKVSMVFQAAQNALNPVMTIKEQMLETMIAHDCNLSEKEMIDKASKLLEYVRLEPQRVLKAFPHELSGGMKQRVMIAFALLLDPELLILDEPTTALDVITQDYIFDILAKIHKDLDITMLILTHDIGVVAKVADRVGVMYAGTLVDVADVYTVFDNANHPYTASLINAAPSLEDDVNKVRSVGGNPPNLLRLPSGCTFHPRCREAREICKTVCPKPVKLGDDLVSACLKYSPEYAKEFQTESKSSK